MGKEKDPRHEHRKRMREALMNAQRDDELPDYQLLEMLLFYALPRIDTRVIAHNIMEHCNNSLAEVFDASPQKLAQVKGVSENFAVILKLVLTCARRYSIKKAEKSIFNGAGDIGKFRIRLPWLIGVKSYWVSPTIQKIVSTCLSITSPI